MPTPVIQDAAPLASTTYLVVYTHTGSIFDRIETYIEAYSAADAEARLRTSMSYYEVTIHRVTALGEPEPVTCTYDGTPGSDGPWQWLTYVDPYGPVLVCDVHGDVANPCVYESDTTRDPSQPEHYTGPCRHHPDLIASAERGDR